MSKTVKQVAAKQLDEPVQLGARYAEGIGCCSREKLAKVFHKDAVVYGDIAGIPSGGPVETLYQVLESNGPFPDMTYHVDVIEATPSTTVLRVHLDNIGGDHDCIDRLSAYKVDGRWQLVCKIFQEYKL